MSIKSKRDPDYCCLNGCTGNCCAAKRRKIKSTANTAITILDVLEVDICRSVILEHVPLGEILRSERVCSRWRDAMHHYIRGSHRHRRRLRMTAPRHPSPSRPRSLLPLPLPLDETRAPSPWFERSLYKWGTSVEAGLCTVHSFGTVAESCPNLKELTFYGVPDPHSVRNYIGKLEKMNKISFRNLHAAPNSNAQHSDQSIGIFLENNTLEELTIVGNDQLTGDCFKNLQPNLKHLRIRDCPVLNYQELLSIKCLSELEILDLSRNSHEIMQNIHLVIENTPKLERFELCWYNMVEMGDDILKVLSRLDCLKHIILRHNSNVDDRWLHALAVRKKLISLDVSYCEAVTYEGLSTALRSFGPSLEALGAASMRQLNDQHVETIVRLCPNLELLDLQQCVGLSSNLVSYLCRVSRRRARWRLPRLRLRLCGTLAPQKYTPPRHLILDYTSQPQLLSSPEHENELQNDDNNAVNEVQRLWFMSLPTNVLLGERDSLGRV